MPTVIDFRALPPSVHPDFQFLYFCLDAVHHESGPVYRKWLGRI